MCRLPSQHLASAARVGDGNCGITEATFANLDVEVHSRYLTDHVQNLTIGIADARAEIEQEFIVLGERLDGEYVGLGEIRDVDVVSNARSIRGRVIIAEEIEVTPSPKRGVQRERDEVYLGIVRFWVRGCPARGVEIA